MKASELADKLEKDSLIYHDTYLDKAATMLRYQQAEIESLKHWKNTWRPFLKEHLGVDKPVPIKLDKVITVHVNPYRYNWFPTVPNLKLTFDGDSEQLKSAEVIK